MSRYSDKKAIAVCAREGCSETGTTLKIQAGVLDWWCEEHADE